MAILPSPMTSADIAAAGGALVGQVAVSITYPVDGQVITSNHPDIQGIAPPYSLVTVLKNGLAVGTALSSSNGVWLLSLPSSLNGDYTLSAYASPSATPVSITINDPLRPASDAFGNPALFDINNIGGVYWVNNTLYSSPSDVYSAIGATVSGVRASFGGMKGDNPYQYYPVPDMSTLPTGMSYGNGFSGAAIVSSELNITSAGGTQNPYATFTLTGYTGRAFEISAEARFSGANPPALSHTLSNAQLGGNLSSSAAYTATMASRTTYGSASATGGASYYGLRGTNTVSGTVITDNWNVRENIPLPGWVDYANGDSTKIHGGWSAVYKFVVPALPSAGTFKMIGQIDTGDNNNRVLLRISDTGDIRMATTLGTVSQSNQSITIGNVAPGQTFHIAIGHSPGKNADLNTGIIASINGTARKQYSAIDSLMPGSAFVRIGQDSAGGSQFDGTFNQIAYFKGRQPSDWYEYASRLNDSVYVAGGDSYMDGAGGVQLKTLLAAASGKPVINIAVGGTSLFSQRTTYLSKSYLWSLPFIHWDGSDNGFSSISADLQNYRAMRSAQGGLDKFLFICPIAVPNPGTASSPTPNAQSLRCADRRAAMIADFGDPHVFDALPTLQALGNGSADDNNDIAAGLVPRSLMLTQTSGEVHLGLAAMTAVANALVASGKLPTL